MLHKNSKIFFTFTPKNITMKNPKKWLLFFLIFLAITFVIGVVSYYGKKTWQKKASTISYVHPFHFINQDGDTITKNHLLGKVTVVEYFFTTCQGICVPMNEHMKKVYNHYSNNPEVQFFSHTCLPEEDSVPVLKRFADSLQVNTKQWQFLTGRKDSLYFMARNSYLLDDPKSRVEKIEDQFIHTQYWALVDKEGNVRFRIYNGLDAAELPNVIKDINRLLEEK